MPKEPLGPLPSYSGALPKGSNVVVASKPSIVVSVENSLHSGHHYKHQQQQYEQQNDDERKKKFNHHHDGDSSGLSTCDDDDMIMEKSGNLMSERRESMISNADLSVGNSSNSNIGSNIVAGADGNSNETNSTIPLSIISNNNEEEFKPTLSCVNCRKLHRKCDKRQPKCTECVTHARECKYTPGKNKQYIRKSKDKVNSEQVVDNSKYLMVWNQNMVPQTQWATTFVKNSVKKQTVDIYYRKLSMGMSTIQQMKMEDLFFRNGTEELDEDEYSIALFYSIQALCDQYMGRKDKAIEAYNECRKYLGKVYDDLESFTVACTYNYISFFLAGEGEDEISRNYLSLVDLYFKRRSKKLARGLPCFGNSEYFIVNNLDKKRGVTSIFFFDNRLDWKNGQKYSDLVGVAYKISTGNELPQKFVEILDADLNESTYDLQMSVLDDIHILMKQSHKGRSHVPEYVQIGLMMDKLNVALHRLEALRVVLSKNPKNKLFVKLDILKQADAISEIVENPYFSGMLSTFIFAFALAAQVHFESFFDYDITSINPTIKSNIFNCLNRDLKGLNQFASKYGRTTKVYGHIMNAIEALIINISPSMMQQQQQQQNTEVNIQPPSDSISSYTSPNQTSTSSPPSSYESTSVVCSSDSNQKRKDLPSSQFLANTMKNFMHSKKKL